MTVRSPLCRLFRLLAVLALSAQAFAQERAAGPGSAKPSPPQAKLETVAVVSDQAPVNAGDKVVATVEKGRMFGVIERRGDQVEIQVCVGTQILRGTLAVSHVKFLSDADVDLAAEWLKMSKDLDQKVDIPAYRAKLVALVERVATTAAAGKTPREKVLLIDAQLFNRERFRCGQSVSRPDRLLDLKQGNCLGFSLLYVCAARRLKMPLYLVLAPGHAFVRYDDGHERFSIETTEEGTLHDSDAYLQEHKGAHRFSGVEGMDLLSLPSPRALGALFSECGRELREMGKLGEACEKYAKAVEINPGDAHAYRSWDYAVREVGKHADAYYNLGMKLCAMGQHAEACEKLAKAVEINPRYPEAYYGWGWVLGKMGKHAEACEKYAKALEIDPRYANAYSGWGWALGKMGKHAEACEKFAKAVEIDPRHANAHSNWGVALRQMGRYAEACEKHAKAAELAPRDTDAHFEWGNTLASMLKYDPASKEYAKAVQIDPQHADAYSKWGEALGKMGRPAEAAEAYHSSGVALGKTGNYGGACEKFAKAVEINPRSAEAYSNWGGALVQMGKAAEACEKYAKAVEIAPRDADAHYNWGRTLASMLEYDQACGRFAKATEIDPRHAAAWFDWGVALACLEKNAEAIEKLDKAVALDPALKPKVEELRKELLGKK